MFTKRAELTTVVELIEELKQLPPKTKVYANGTYGYMHIGTDEKGNQCITFDDSPLNDEYEEYKTTQRYVAIHGFNTKQWWAYDNETDEYCDPPKRVLDELKKHSDFFDIQEDFFNEILSTEPDWLNDKGYRYNDIDI